MSYYMALHFSNFHHYPEVFDYLIHLISERIQECNICSMHYSFDNYFQLYLHNLALLFAKPLFL